MAWLIKAQAQGILSPHPHRHWMRCADVALSFIVLIHLQSKQQKVCSIYELKKVEIQLPKSVSIAFERDPPDSTTEEVLPRKWVRGSLLEVHY